MGDRIMARRKAIGTAALAILLLMPLPAAAVTLISGGHSVRATVFTQGKQNPATLNTRLDGRSWVSTPPTTRTRFTNDVVVPPGNAGVSPVTAEAVQTAFWESDGRSGDVEFVYGWNFNFRPSDGVTGAEFVGTTPDWTYTFFAPRSGTFRLTYIVNATGNTFGLGGWNLIQNGNTVLDLQNPLTPVANGVGDFGFAGGQNHTFSLVNNANIVPGLGNAQLQGQMSASFRFFITDSAVPEPATWAMLIMGFAVIGGALRSARVRRSSWA